MFNMSIGTRESNVGGSFVLDLVLTNSIKYFNCSV